MRVGPVNGRIDLLRTRSGRRALFALLYFSEGAPIGFLWWTLPVILRRAGMESAALGALVAMLALPWTLKWAWAPLVDVLRGPRWTLRGWIVASQAVMLATLAPLWFVGPDAVARSPWLVALLLAHACAAATQDVAVDALAIRSTPEHERGALNGVMQVGMLVGRSMFGGGALLLGAAFGERALVGLLLGAQLAALGAGFLYRPIERPVPTDPSPETGVLLGRRAAFVRTLGAALESPRTWVALLFAAVSGAAFEAIGAMAGPLLVDRGLGDDAVGLFFAVPVVVGLGLGALAGGFLSDRFGRRRVVLLASLGICAAVLALASVCDPKAGASDGATLVLLGVTYLGAGVFTASSYALFMDLTDPRLGSTQFSAFMGATNGCELWSAWLAGRQVAARGYPAAFLLAAGISVLALPLLLLLGPRSGRDASGAGTRSDETAQ